VTYINVPLLGRRICITLGKSSSKLASLPPSDAGFMAQDTTDLVQNNTAANITKLATDLPAVNQSITPTFVVAPVNEVSDDSVDSSNNDNEDDDSDDDESGDRGGNSVFDGGFYSVSGTLPGDKQKLSPKFMNSLLIRILPY
jgi:hypothetical protein